MKDFTSPSETPWYDQKIKLNTVIIGNDVTKIGDYSFSSCYGLRNVDFGRGVITIGKCAFSDCYLLTNITIPDSVTTIQDYAFSGCFLLKVITIPDSVTRIGIGICSDCDNLTSIEVSTSNNNFIEIEGVLYSKNKTILYQYPNGKEDKLYSIDSKTTTILDYAFNLFVLFINL